MTILVRFHHKQSKNFKAYYQDYVCCYLRWAFPNLVSYSRFVQLSQEVLVPLSIFLNTRFGECSGTSFIDATPLPVCHNCRISAHRVFTGYAERSKTSMGSNYIWTCLKKKPSLKHKELQEKDCQLPMICNF